MIMFSVKFTRFGSSSSLLTTWVQTNKHIMVQSHAKNDNTKCWINDEMYVNVRLNWEKYNTEHKKNTLRGNSISHESPHRKTPQSPEGASLGVKTFACIIMKFGRRLGNSAYEASAKFHSTSIIKQLTSKTMTTESITETTM